jgi:NADH dehydrogenase [ubiquinone] 1 alpha subcomplex assembly factor 7
VDIFHRPGECDLTANVDFAYLKESMQDLVPVYGPITQNQFLSHMGIMVRLEKLFAGAGGDKTKMDRIREGAQRLINPVQMGNEYSVLGISTNNGPQHPFQLEW